MGGLGCHEMDSGVLMVGMSHASIAFPVLRHADNQFGKFFRRGAWGKVTVYTILKKIGNAADRAGDDRQTEGHGLDDHVGKAFRVFGREAEQM